MAIKAFISDVHGFPAAVIPAATAAKARHMVVSSLREVGYTESAQYKNVRIVRAKQFDAWAQSAKAHYHTLDDVQHLHNLVS